MSKKIMCVIGGSGLVGFKLLQKISKEYEMYGTFNGNPIKIKNIDMIKIDISSKRDCKKISELKPDVIVNCAALTNVDYCEEFKDKAFKVNVLGTRNLAEIANKIGSKFIHISTDGVFDGMKKKYSENNKTLPINVYGQTKLESEKEASIVTKNSIIRSSVIFGWFPLNMIKSRRNSIKPMNFALWVLTKLAKKQSLKIVNDQFNTPTLADNLADVIIQLSKNNFFGIYHCSGLTCVNRFEFAKKISKIFGYPENLIIPISSKELQQIAKRPRRTCLDCNKISEKGINLLTIDDALQIMHNQIKEECPDLICPLS